MSPSPTFSSPLSNWCKFSVNTSMSCSASAIDEFLMVVVVTVVGEDDEIGPAVDCSVTVPIVPTVKTFVTQYAVDFRVGPALAVGDQVFAHAAQSHAVMLAQVEDIADHACLVRIDAEVTILTDIARSNAASGEAATGCFEAHATLHAQLNNSLFILAER